MRLKLLSVLIILLSGIAVNAQTVTLNMEKAPLKKVFKEIARQTNLSFIYKESVLKNTEPITIVLRNTPVGDALRRCLENQSLIYEMDNGIITILPQYNANTKGTGAVAGVIGNRTGEPMGGTSVLLKGQESYSTLADATGRFFIPNVSFGKYSLIISRIGYEQIDTTIQLKQQQLMVKTMLQTHTTTEQNVIVNGIFSRPKENFTGAATVVTGEQLRTINATNMLEGLKTFDASFQMPTSDIFGSDPNKVPTVQMRGTNSINKTTLTDEAGYLTNPPLVIIDGFEVPNDANNSAIRRLMDMDINLISNVTLLKDAVATAIYGAKSANGVIVVETKKPKAGEVNVRYTATLALETPDLSSFNLMNAREKLAFEEYAGVYKSKDPNEQQQLTDLYNLVKRNVEKGVNTYWLSQPLRNTFSNTHSLGFDAGAEKMTYSVQLLYAKNQGVMKGSDRENINGRFTMRYNGRKLKADYEFIIGNTKAFESPYGSFDNYARLNPYWLPVDEYGRVSQYIDIFPVSSIDGSLVSLPPSKTSTVLNPLYNATLNTLNKSVTNNIQQNFRTEWTIASGLKLNGTFSVQTENRETDIFKPARHSDFFKITDLTEKGSYDQGLGKSLFLQGSLNLNYGRSFGRHTIFTTLGSNIQSNTDRGQNLTVYGFASEKMDDLLYGLKVKDKPGGTYSMVRTAGFYGNASYAYDSRYLLDFSGRSDGSSVFGTNRRFGNLWSMGAGWNLHKEHFFHIKAINQLKLRASYGYTGSVSFPSYAATTTYKYHTGDSYINLIPATIIAYGNPDLKWQQTRKFNIGADMGFFDNRILLNVNIYKETTSGLIMSNPTVPSTGFSDYSNNLGSSENTGLDASLTAFILRKPERKLFWSISTSWFANKNKLINVSEVLESQNKQALAAQLDPSSPAYGQPVQQFKEGRSVSLLYAVRSLGIDPSTGNEIFLTKDGKQTFVWSQDDMVPMGDLQPKFNITLNNSFSYKWLRLNFGTVIRLGGVQYNNTLASQVENLNPELNVDRRAADGRWLKPGDVSDYKGLVDIDGFPKTGLNTNATSRFVKKNNAIEITGISLDPGQLLEQYITKYTNLFISKINDKTKDYLKSDMIDVRFYMNNLFNLSSIKKSRGTAYPFNRSYSLNISINF
ncbi:SusC/RagA family TonB-linked outer membrane protein [Niabella sp. CJ426]|uniref:SusC/RagA family TonB-linked outer membrane protein n=1 Tax=Niabella sp. CJ426 TaxID=3393740 RepID=UPI003D02EA69